MFLTVIKRLSEPSTWAGIAAVLGILGVNPMLLGLIHTLLGVAPDVVQAITGGAAIAAGSAAVVVAEKPADY